MVRRLRTRFFHIFQCILRWKFCQERNVTLVDEARTHRRIFAFPSLTQCIQYDHVWQNVEPYFALSPRTLQERVRKLEKDLPFSFHIHIKDGQLALTGETARKSRAMEIADLVDGFAQHLPNLSFYASDHDRGNIVLGTDQLDEALRLARENRRECALRAVIEAPAFKEVHRLHPGTAQSL
jgi:hypothetical protein